jgi:uncharacterized protein YndB with AHSA1/START domain
MIRVEHTTFINRPVGEVFAFLAEPANQTRWQDDLVRAEMVSGNPQTGAEFVEVRKFMGREMESRLQLTAFEPDRLLSAKVVKGPVPFEVTQTLEPDGSGTKLTMVLEGEPGGFFKLAEGMVRKQLEADIQKDSLRLKEVLEA